jgi:hypothetical protein
MVIEVYIRARGPFVSGKRAWAEYTAVQWLAWYIDGNQIIRRSGRGTEWLSPASPIPMYRSGWEKR